MASNSNAKKDEEKKAAAETTQAEVKPAEKAKPAPKRVKKYEVARVINLGKGDVREPGAELAENEVPAALLERLLTTGFLRDADAPVPPSQAEQTAAFDRLARIAQKIGVLVRDGAEYRLGEQTFKGLTAFRSGVSADDLEKAIVGAFEE